MTLELLLSSLRREALLLAFVEQVLPPLEVVDFLLKEGVVKLRQQQSDGLQICLEKQETPS